MSLFANTTAADFKKGDIIMFAMGSSSPDRVASRADRCLGGQFACAQMCYGVFSTSWSSGVVRFVREKERVALFYGVHILGEIRHVG
jgi:hypothetical protein